VKGRKDLVASAAYLPEPAAVAAARKFVRDTLRSWLDTAPGAEADGGLVDDAVLLTSELVTNAVVHAGTQVQVTCKLAAGAVEVVVRDSHPARMVPGPAPDDTVPAERTGGRGLLLPSALAAAWGVSYGTDAKAVWFRMGLPGTPGGASGAEADPAALEAVVPASAWNVTGGAPEGASPASAPAGPASAGPVPASTMPLYNAAARSGYDKLLDQCVASARLIASADSAYALVADEDGDLGVRAASGLGPAAWLRTAPSVSTVPFMVDGQVTGVLAVAAARPGRFAEAEVRRLQQLADQMAPALERARLAELERARRARIGVLAEAGTLLAGPLDQDRILAVAGQVAVPRLAAWCAVLLSGPGGDLRLTVARHADESQAGALTWLLNRGCDLAPPAIAADARDGAARSWPLAALVPAQAPPGVADLAARGAWCFPLTTGGGPLGLLILGGPHGGPPSREVQRLAEDLAARIALALENSRLTTRQQQASDALRAALVPPELPRIPGVELAFAHDLPTTDVPRSDLSRADAGGGDFCDVFPVTGRRWRFAIGEVCGTDPGDLLLCVTDGVTRRRDGDRQLDDDDGLARLLAACTGLTADVVADKVHEEVRTFGGHPAVDGMAVLVIRAAT
jgi:GAF domain-containing protein/anti-sigma regulatory factor (Ser/Thr protein kinase)